MLRQLILVIFSISVFVTAIPFYIAPKIPHKIPEVEILQTAEAYQPKIKPTKKIEPSKTQPVTYIVYEIGRATVPNTPDSSGQNAILAARLTNGAIIQPGKIYSYNQVVGVRTPSRGFLDGQTVVNAVYGPQYEMGIGGGICRTSTVIHHAVLAAGLEVVERHNHSLPVSYSELGKDAAVAYGSLDYRFRNDTGNPVKIVTSADKTTVSVKIITKSERNGG